MKILFDHQAFTGTIYGGISRYFADLMGNLTSHGHEVNLATQFSNNFYLRDQPYFKGVPYSYFLGYRLTCTALSHLNRLGAAIKLCSNSFDVFHPTFYNPYFLPFIGKKPFVITYHDAIKDKFGEKYGHLDNVSKDVKKKLLTKASKIIAVSENTKKDLVEVFDISPEKVAVIHHATVFHQVRPEPIVGLPEKYLLYVGSRNDYKQFIPFIKAVATTLDKNHISLICAGGDPFNEEEIEIIKELGIRHLVSAKKVSDGALKTLYQNAIAFVYPSKYEGFGIPILEAFASNCPAVLSDSSCFPEVAQDAALYFDTASESSTREAIENIIFNAPLREKLIEKGQQRFLDFSIEKMTRQTLEVYASVI